MGRRMEKTIVCRVLTGPTACGKTEASLALAEKHGWEIACMDSMQIYRGMDIGTAKPSPEERRRVKHHLLDIRDPREGFSVSLYREAAEALIREKWQREGKELLFVGGTGLYLQALMHPMEMGAAPADPDFRKEMWALADSPGGPERIHALLRKADPETADRLPVGDIRRSIRALEVHRATGIPFSRQPQRQEETGFRWRVAALDLPREILYARINRRVEQMVARGLRTEVKGLLDAGVSPESQSMQAIGYRQMICHLRGDWSLDKAVEEIQKDTRHYAKRQGTFLRREPAVRYVDGEAPDRMEQLESIFLSGG